MAFTRAFRKKCPDCMYPACPDRIWGSLTKPGLLFQCKTCGNRYMSGGSEAMAGTLYHLVFRRGIAADRSVPSWQYFPTFRKVYVTCVVCESLLPVPMRDIRAKGFVGGLSDHSCTTCSYCNFHCWPFLEGWREVGRTLATKQKARKGEKKAVAVK